MDRDRYPPPDLRPPTTTSYPPYQPTPPRVASPSHTPPTSRPTFDILPVDNPTPNSAARSFGYPSKSSNLPSPRQSRSVSPHGRSRSSIEIPLSTWRTSPGPPSPSNSNSPLNLHHHPPSFHTPSRSSFWLPSCPSIPEAVRPWMPFILWGITSIGFLLAITVWRTQLFQGLDNLSHYLRSNGAYGKAILFLCIFITTFPPLPLYSTLIVLSGYTFGAWIGFAISYCAALTGAVVVYAISYQFLQEYLKDVLQNTAWVKRVIRSIERRPKLLFLIRLAPYPYNLLNALLAASPTLQFKTYFICTALSLFKLIIHTTAGSTIHQFAEYHTPNDKQDEGGLTRTWAIIGGALCIGIFVYLSYLARKAVEEEDPLEEEEAGLIAGEMSEVTTHETPGR